MWSRYDTAIMAPSPKSVVLLLLTLTAEVFVTGHAQVADFEALEAGGMIAIGLLETFYNVMRPGKKSCWCHDPWSWDGAVEDCKCTVVGVWCSERGVIAKSGGTWHEVAIRQESKALDFSVTHGAVGKG